MKCAGRSRVKSIRRKSLLLRTSFRVVLLVAVTLPAFVALASVTTAHATGPQSDQMVVYVSILPQAFFVARIGGENVRVNVLVGPGESPATFDPTPRQMADIAAARVFFTTGVPMEEALLPRVRHNFPAVAIIDTRIGIEQLGEHDPHVWLSPRLAQIQARNIYEGLASLDPEHAVTYQQNHTALKSDLETLDRELADILAPVRGKEMIVFHPAFGYLAAAYGLKQVALEEGGLEPGPHHLAEVITMIRERGVEALFVQPQFSATSARRAAAAMEVRVVELDPLARDYLVNMRAMAMEIQGALASE